MHLVHKTQEIHMKKIVIAVDGPSSSGKSTMAKALAKEIGYIYVDSGAMYRAVTLYAMRAGLFAEDGSIDTTALQAQMDDVHIEFRLEEGKEAPQTYLNGECVEDKIRTLEVSNHVSPIATLPFVREALVRMQQEMGRKKGIIMDGRDIGTTVFPDAELKIFITASVEVRAFRRHRELGWKGEHHTMEEIRQNVIERDRIDSTREVSPLRQAPDAIVLDNSDIPMSEQLRMMKEWYEAAARE